MTTTTWTLAAAVVVGTVGLAMGAGEATPAAPVPAEIVRKAGTYLGGVRNGRVEITTTMKMEAEGMKQEFTSHSIFAMERPRKASLVLKSGVLGATVVCDGSNVYVSVPMLKRYSVQAAPPGLSGLGREMGVGLAGGFPIGAALLADHPAEALLEGVKEGHYVGRESIDGEPCHHLRFTQDAFDWDVWIEAGDRPLIRRILPDLSKVVSKAEPFAGMGNVKTEWSFQFDHWQVNTNLPADQFVFTPPEGSQKTDSLFGSQGSAEGVPHGTVRPPSTGK